MSRGLGRLQQEILARLRQRPGGDVVEAHFEPQVRLAPGIHDMRLVARRMNAGFGGFSDPSRQAAFSRALAGLVRAGAVKAHTSLVPLVEHWPGRAWDRHVHVLSDGVYFMVPPGPGWRRRFVELPR